MADRKLLAVDDESQTLVQLAGLLESEYQLLIAKDGARAIELAIREKPDLILLDVVMPEMDGYEVCRRLKSDPRTQDIMVIFLTVRDDPSHEARGLEVGAMDYLFKPISPPLLFTRVRNALRLKASYDALMAAKLAAESASRAKSAFLANMSHELRTPMNAIMGLTHLAQRNAVDPKLRDQLGKIATASKHLLGVINDVLDISKIEANRLELHLSTFTLGDVVRSARNLVDKSAADKGLRLRIDVSAEDAQTVLRGDTVRLRQVLLNLISNAIKFTDVGLIQVRLQLEPDGARSVLLRAEVQDSGIGIAPADQSRIFDAFEQSDVTLTQRLGGTGLGLAICKLLVQAMGGQIGVESTPGQGSTFRFSVRFDRATRAESAGQREFTSTEESLRDRFAGARILLAEDEPVNQEVAREVLEVVGLIVDVAEDGARAVELARQVPYDLILMDLQMPQLNGIEATRAIRALPEHAHTPILAMTANAYNEDRIRCMQAGMNDHAGKPIEPASLYALLHKWLTESAALRGSAA